jgi:hypothetical protein
MVEEYIKIFHIFHIKLGIKDSECHLVLKHCSGLHRYIQTDMEFMDNSSLGSTYRYVLKIKKNFK